MSRRFLTPVGLHSATSDPSSASIGNMYFNTASNVLRLYFNSQWNSVHNITASYGLSADYIDFSLNPLSGASVARLQWTDGEGTLTVGLKGGNVNLNLGQEEVALCYNGTGSALSVGTVVYIDGAQGQRPSIKKASNVGEGTSSKVLGLVAETIANGAEGFVTTFGMLRNVNTSLYAPGTALWLSSSAGLFTSTKSYAPSHLVFIGYSVKQSSTAGQIFVTPQNGYELYELHNVSASNPNNNDILYYNTSASLWQTASVQSLITNLVNMDYIDFDITPTASNTVGRMNWNSTAGTVAVTMDNGPTLTTALIGQGQFIKATNKDDVNLVKGDVVYISGAIGNRVAIKLATASVNGLEKSPIGMCAEDISINSSGFVVISGTISGINTQAYAEGDAVWLSASPGKITNIRPQAPLRGTVIGHVINSNIAVGSINVHVVEGLKLSFLDDVVLTASTFTNNDVLAYNLSASYWENTSIQNKITTASVGFANRSASSTISSSATVATHAGTASSIAGSLVTGTVASATVASHAGTASSINASLITGTTLPAAIVNSSLTSLGTLSNLTVSGSLNVDSGTLFVDATNNEVGILTTSPASALHVVGGALVTRNLSASGTLFSGSAILGGANGLYLGLGDATYAGTASGAAIQLGTTSGSRTIRLFTPNSSGNNGLRLFISDSNTSVWSDLLISPTFSVRSSQLTASTEIFGVNTSTGLTTASFLSVTGSTAITGNLNVDSGTLFVDSANNEVGIGTSTPASALHVVGGAYITGAASFGGTVAATSTTQAAGTSNTQLATTEFVSRVARYSAENLSVSTSSVAGFFVIDVTGSRSTSLNGIIFMGRGTASRLYVGQINTGINGAASAGYARGYVENNAGTALAIGTTVPLYYIAW
jgi:hypothetical protein